MSSVSSRRPGRNYSYGEKPYHKKEVLEKLYLEQGMSMAAIGEKYGVSRSAISNWLRKRGIPTRGSRRSSVECECAWCGETYYEKPEREERTTFCSRKCKADWQADQPPESHPLWDGGHVIEVDCPWCGERFETTEHQVRKSNNNFCSYDCSGQWMSENLSGENSPNWRNGGGVETDCDYCGETIRRKPSEIENSEHCFCSRSCMGKWISENRVGPNHYRWGTGGVETACAFCGESLTVPPHRAEQYDNNFCSQKCMGKWMSENIAGENHHSWGGGRIDYYGPNWYQQRIKARERDNYICQRCYMHEKELPHNLHVHHIVPFRSFGYIPGENENYKQANELNNLVSLCPSCHVVIEHES